MYGYRDIGQGAQVAPSDVDQAYWADRCYIGTETTISASQGGMVEKHESYKTYISYTGGVVRIAILYRGFRPPRNQISLVSNQMSLCYNQISVGDL